MLDNAQLEKLRDFKKSLLSTQKPVQGREAPAGRVVPKIRETASGGQPRPWKSRFKTKDILREGPSQNLAAPVWSYAPTKVTAEDRKAQSKGYYVGCRWSPAPGQRNWQKQQYATK